MLADPTSRPPIRIVHLITDLDTGGAEVAMCRLLKAFDPSRFQSTVVSLTAGGPLAGAVETAGARLIELNMRAGRLNFAGFYHAYRVLRSLQPDIVQTWLYHADLVGLVAGRLAGVPHIVWNVRCSDLNLEQRPRRIGMMLRVLAWLSRRPAAIVSNSVAGRRVHERLGYRPRQWNTIGNGIDTDVFRPAPARGAAFRRELNVADGTPLVGLVARFHPMKDQDTFVRAASIIAQASPAHFVLAGRGVAESRELRTRIDSLGLTGRIHLLAERSDVAEIFAALDVAVLSSTSEGFPNVLIEAMACGTPCVTTDAGDAALIVADAARVVPVRDPAALAGAILRVLGLAADERRQLGLDDRGRVIANYTVGAIARRYQALYEELVASRVRQSEPSCAA
jgi:glycosyltransferase involved in cell wall biosynthesis